MDKKRTIAEHIEVMFGVKMSRHKNLKDALNSMERNKLILVEKERIVDRYRRLVLPGQEITINNAVLIHGLLGSPRKVKEVFENRDKRKKLASWMEMLIKSRNELVGVGIKPKLVNEFISIVNSNVSLKEKKLPNIFYQLPQLLIENPSLVQSLVANAALLTEHEKMLLCYIQDDLETAYHYTKHADRENGLINQFCKKVERKYEEAVEFDEVLDSFLRSS